MAALWFGRVVLVGVAANLLLAIPTFLRPAASAAMLGIPLPEPILWLRFAALLIVLLSCFYIPAGLNPLRYRATAWLAVVSRLVGVIFFGLQPAEYWLLALVDLTFLLPQAVLLMLASRVRPFPTTV